MALIYLSPRLLRSDGHTHTVRKCYFVLQLNHVSFHNAFVNHVNSLSFFHTVLYVFRKGELEHQPFFSSSQLLQSQMTRAHTEKVPINQSKGEKERLPESVCRKGNLGWYCCQTYYGEGGYSE
jgi:hypothetical protein